MNPTAIVPSIAVEKPTRVRYGVLAFACSLSMITYLDRVCFGSVVGFIQKDFNLTDVQKGWLFWAFAFAYAAFEIPSGWLGDMFGARKTLIRIVLWWSIFTALTGLVYPNANWPLFAFGAMFLVRFFFGIGEAGAYPNIARAFHNWFPFEERGFVKGAVWMAGRFAGGVTPLIVLMLLQESTDENGAKVTHWRHMFWIFGGLGLVWSFLFYRWYRDRPEEMAGVNQAEIALITGGHAKLHDHLNLPAHPEGNPVSPPVDPAAAVQRSPAVGGKLGKDAIPASDIDISQPKSLGVPWGKLITNGNLWILCIMYFMGAYGWYFNITYLPDYLTDFHGIVPGEKWSWEFWRKALMTGMPLLVGSIACLMGGVLSDLFIRTTGNRKWGRRLFGVVGKGCCAVCYLSCIYVDSAWGIVWAVSLAAFFNDLTMGAAWASCLDIGGRYAGIVAGCMNSIGNLGGAMAGIVTGWVVSLFTHGLAKTEAGYLDAARPGWTFNFMIFSGVYFFAMFLWFFFDSTKQVPQE